MSFKSMNEVEKNLVEIGFTIDKETFEKAVNAAYKKNIGKMSIPGFRKGKAPRAMVEKLYGKGVFYDDALNAVVPAAYDEAVTASGADVVSQPQFDVVSIDENGVEMKAKVYTKPVVEIADYKGLAIDRVIAPVTDEEIDREIEAARKKNAREIEVTDRAAAKDDTAVIDFEGFCDGVAFDGGKGTDYSLKLGSGSFIPGFEDQVIGHNAGESFDVNVTFPEDYGEASLAGKPAVFKVTVKSIKFEELPALDDEFAKDVSEFDTLDEYKASVKANIEKRHNDAADADVENKVIEAVIEKLNAEIPECMFENEVDQGMQDYAQRLSMQGIDFDTYLKYTGMKADDLRLQLRPRAEKQVKSRLALEKIAELEKIEISEDEINAEIDEIAKNYGMTADDVKARVDSSLISADLKLRNAVKLVREAAVITDKAPEETEKKD
ncbi:MAG: trigger factor [Lachnospiraceae bacterium]|nr:trigger factor [Lachnospiraceae bacterium]